MKNEKVTSKLTHGMYVLTTPGGGCIVDAVAQVGKGKNPTIIVSVNKNNYTNKLLKENTRFALSIIGKNTNPEIIKTFGFSSSKDTDKFANIPFTEIENVNVIDDSLGYIICEKEDEVENETHTVFFGKMIEGDITKDEVPMSYLYYQDNKDRLLKINTDDNKTAWVCTVCGYIYYGEEVPEGFTCPMCGKDKSFFTKK